MSETVFYRFSRNNYVIADVFKLRLTGLFAVLIQRLSACMLSTFCFSSEGLVHERVVVSSTCYFIKAYKLLTSSPIRTISAIRFNATT